MIETPVGFRCPECARGPRSVVYTTSSTALVKATAIGVVVGCAVGVLWGVFPDWAFYCALLLGFGVAESMAWAANYKRGRELQVAAALCVLLGIIISRLTIAQRDPFLTVDMLLNNATDRGVARAFQLEIIPDVVFMGISFLIVIVRFR
jgi:hypothetical protein